MKKFLFIVSLLAVAAFAQNRVAGYFPHWAQYSGFAPAEVRYNFLTEVRYGYLTPSGSELLFTDESDKGNFLELVKNAKAAKVKIVVAVGGVGAESSMQDAYSNAGDFVKAAVAFKKEFGIDGFELDGGAVSAGDISKLVNLANELVSAGLAAGIAVPGDEGLASSFNGLNVSKLDAISLWFADQANAGDSEVKPNSNTAENEKVLATFASTGIPKNKLFPIVPFYGRTFYHAKGLGSAHEGAGSGNDGVLQYKDIMDKFKGKEYSVSFDDKTESEVAVSDNETIVFNGIPSAKALSEVVKKNGYGGVAAFDLSGDSKEPIISILVTIGQVLRPDVDYKKKKR
ncbi:hypothetical protein AGMMS49938_01380 [Fibrobacterales bacterium]|nr:hypothetical protein AGMMS49938_01380 [Fibrobacterales bacterium]